jgi:osmotically inducible protein OsmC
MAMATLLAEADHAPEELSVSADCRFDPDALRITTIELEVAARAPGLDPAAFADITHRAEALCPVSNALRGNVEILVRARLEAGAGG